MNAQSRSMELCLLANATPQKRAQPRHDPQHTPNERVSCATRPHSNPEASRRGKRGLGTFCAELRACMVSSHHLHARPAISPNTRQPFSQDSALLKSTLRVGHTVTTPRGQNQAFSQDSAHLTSTQRAGHRVKQAETGHREGNGKANKYTKPSI